MTQQQDPYAGMSPQEAHAAYWNTQTPAYDSLSQLGFGPSPKPDYACPVIDPRDLQSLNNAQLGELLAKLTGWFNFALERLAYTEASLVSLNEEMRQLMILLLDEVGAPKNETTGKAISLADRKNLAERNTRYQQMTRHKTIQLVEEKVLKAKKESCENNTKMVSRQITLRTNMNDADSLTQGLPNRGTYQSAHAGPGMR